MASTKYGSSIPTPREERLDLLNGLQQLVVGQTRLAVGPERSSPVRGQFVQGGEVCGGQQPDRALRDGEHSDVVVTVGLGTDRPAVPAVEPVEASMSICAPPRR